MSDTNPFALSNIQPAVTPAPSPAAANSNPFALGAIEADQRQDQRAALFGAVRANPDQAAEASRLAKRYPAPADVLLRNLQDVQLQAAVDKADQALAASPKLAAHLRNDPFRAKMAHDDLDTLGAIEQFFGDTGGSMRAGVHRAASGSAGALRAVAEFAADASEWSPVSPFRLLEESGQFGGNPLRRLAEGFGLAAETAQTNAKLAAPKATGIVDGGFQSGVQSLTQNLLNLPLAFLPGGQPAALLAMSGQTGGDAYQTAREKGLPMQQALPFAVSQAAIEYATEKIPVGRLIGDLKAGTPAFQTVVRQIAAEVPGEQVATILQDLNEWAVLNPEKPFVDYLAERPSAAAQTLIATVVGAGGNVAVGKVLEASMSALDRSQTQTARAEVSAADLARAMALAAQSRLRERSPETFAEVAQALADEPGGAPAEVRFDARTLVGEDGQGGVLNQDEIALIPGMAEQVAEALAAGGEVTVPMGQLMAVVAGTPLEQKLLEHARVGDNELSQAEAKQASAQAEAFLQQEAQRVVEASQEAQALTASADAVREQVLAQLTTAGRFSADVNGSYASLVRDFYTVTAGRMGIDPADLYARFPLQVQSSGLGVLDQGDVPQTEQTDPGTGLPLNADGTVTVYHHTSAEKAAKIRASGRMISAGEPDLYFTSTSTPDTGYGDTVVAIRVKPERLQLDDEFPDGRQDFRVSTPGRARRLRILPDGSGALEQRKGAPRGTFNPSTNTISLLKGADLSTFLHETGHFFLEMQARISLGIVQQINGGASVTDGERAIVADMQTTLDWFGIKGSPEMSALDTWLSMSLEEQRPHHEKFARGFEAYLFEGRAPSLELQGLFQRFRAWMLSVYKELKALNVELTADVRAVFDRMLASEEAVKEMEAVRGFEPLFRSAEQAGMTAQEWAAYQVQGQAATDTAIDELQTRSLRDMRWLAGARSRAIKDLQRQASELRREVRRDVRTEVMSLPIYRAWRFLTGRDPTGTAKPDDKVKRGTTLDPATDSLLVAIAKLGGLAREDARKDLGVHPDYHRTESGVFGKPIFRKTGGLTADYMAEALAEAGYLSLDDRGQYSLGDLEDKIAQELNGQPQYSFWKQYSTQGDEAQALPEEAWFGKLDTSALRDMYGDKPDALWRRLSALRMTSEASGIAPDVVAETFGFSSGDELVRALLDADPPSVAVEALTDQRMLERHGDLADERGIERAADAAVHNEARGRFVAAELKALDDGVGAREDTGRVNTKGRRITVNTMVRAAQQFAENIVDRRKVRDLRAGQHAQAETRAARLALRLLAKGDTAGATVAKRDELLQHYAARATTRALDDVQRALAYLKKFDSAAVRQKLPVEYVDQIDKLLERVDLRQVSNKALAKRASLADWIASQQAIGIDPDVPEHLREDAQMLSYRDMTVEQFRGLVATVRQIEHLARLKSKLLTAKDERELQAIKDELVESIERNARGRTADIRTATTLAGRRLQDVRAFGAAHIKAATWARILDGGEDGGPVWEFIVRPANEAGDRETTMRAASTQALADILGPWLREGRTDKKTWFPSINRSLTRQEALVLALNTGNEGNMQRLLGGEGWTRAQIEPVLASLTEADGKVVQAIWDHFESYRPQIAAKERRVFGREPEWVQAVPVMIGGVEFPGGYYPVKYDPAASVRAEEHADAEGAKRQLQGAYGAATTRRGFTKARAEEVTGRPLLYDLSGVYTGFNDVIHDLAWHEWLIDVNRLLKSRAVDEAIRTHYGPDVVRQFKSWRDAVAEGESTQHQAMDVALGRLRQSISMAGLGFNVMSALLQPLGLTQSVVRVGAQWVGKGIRRYVANPVKATREVNALSDFMANRSRTRFRELNELRNRVQAQAGVQRVLQENAYWMMMRVQQMVDVPTWWGAYEKAIAGGSDEARAVALADQAVIDSQGGGQTKDLSAIERGGPAQKLFTVFYSFMNTALNLGVASKMTTRSKAKLAADLLLLYTVPALLGTVLKDALTPGDAGDDEEDLARKLIAAQLSFLFGLVVVGREFAELGNMLAGEGTRGYSGPAGVRLIPDALAFGNQAAQLEFDDAFRRAAINLTGDLFGLPAAQINRSINGGQALLEGETENPAALVLGYQAPR